MLSFFHFPPFCVLVHIQQRVRLTKIVVLADTERRSSIGAFPSLSQNFQLDNNHGATEDTEKHHRLENREQPVNPRFLLSALRDSVVILLVF